MKRLVKFTYIADKTQYLKTKIEELNEKVEILRKDINEIENYYKGVDATIIINKYLEKTVIVESYINNLRRYANYFDWLSDNYKQSHEESLRNVTEVLNEKAENKDNLSYL